MIASFSKFYGKIWVGFCLNTGKLFFFLKPTKRFHFKANRKSIGFSKKSTRDFQNSSPFERSACFYVTTSRNFERSQYFKFEEIFWKTKAFFKKLENYFLFKRTNIENASFPYETTISKANVKTNKVMSTKWTYHKEWTFISNYFIFLIFFFCLKTSYKELIRYINDPNVPIPNYCKCWSFTWRFFFPVSILKYTSKGLWPKGTIVVIGNMILYGIW